MYTVTGIYSFVMHPIIGLAFSAANRDNKLPLKTHVIKEYQNCGVIETPTRA